MKDKILVSIVADHTFESDTNIIGRSGEGGIAQFKITLTDDMLDCEVYLDFEKPNGEKFRTEQLRIVNGVVTYDVPKYLLTENGELKVQLVLKNANDEVWKSSVKRYDNLESINATEEIPVMPVGKIEITDTIEYNVKQYATAQVVDENLKPHNIAEGVSILGIVGTLDTDAKLQEKIVMGNGVVTADTGYDGLSKVTVNVPIPTYEEYDGEVEIFDDNLITFTIDGDTYEAERGITWEEWCDENGSYNVIGAVIGTDGHIYDANEENMLYYNGSVTKTAEIIDGAAYTWDAI